MGAFNVVTLERTNPETGQPESLRIQFKYGDTWQNEYRVGDVLRWGGNDIGDPSDRRVVVYGILDAEPPPGTPEEFEVHIRNGVIEKVVPSTGMYDFGLEGIVVLDP